MAFKYGQDGRTGPIVPGQQKGFAATTRVERVVSMIAPAASPVNVGGGRSAAVAGRAVELTRPYVRSLVLFSPSSEDARRFFRRLGDALDQLTKDAMDVFVVDDVRLCGDEFRPRIEASFGAGLPALIAEFQKACEDVGGPDTLIARSTNRLRDALHVLPHQLPCVVFQTNPPSHQNVVLPLARACFERDVDQAIVERLMTERLSATAISSVVARHPTPTTANVLASLHEHVRALRRDLSSALGETVPPARSNRVALTETTGRDDIITRKQLQELCGAASPTALDGLVDRCELPPPEYAANGEKYWIRIEVEPTLPMLKASVTRNQARAGKPSNWT